VGTAKHRCQIENPGGGGRGFRGTSMGGELIVQEISNSIIQ
jgi:hypothetical protein